MAFPSLTPLSRAHLHLGDAVFGGKRPFDAVAFALWTAVAEVTSFPQRQKWPDEVLWVMGYAAVCFELDRKQLSKDD